MLLTHAPTPATSLHAVIDYGTLTAEQRLHLDQALWELGIEDGHAVNGGGTPYVAERLWRSTEAARVIGLHLRDGHEIALCHDCRTVTTGHAMAECADGAWRCTLPDLDGRTCLGAHLDQQ